MFVRSNILGLIDPFDPLDRGHWSYPGKLLHLEVIPGRDSGPVWYDLLANRPVPLTGGPTPPKFGPTTRLRGRGQVTFDGTDDRGTIPRINLTDGYTLAASVRTTDLAGGGADYTPRVPILSEAPNAYVDFGVGGFGTGGRPISYSDPGALTGPTSVADGRWHRLLATHARDGTHRLFVDGVPVASRTSTYDTVPGHYGLVYLGATYTGTGFAAADLDAVTAWGRPFSVAEALADYLDGLADSPGVFRRIGVSPAIFDLGAAAGFPPRRIKINRPDDATTYAYHS